MAFNGIVMRALARELKETLVGTHISKIAQPEENELIFTIKLKKGTKRLLISANASLPLMYLTEENKLSPDTAPNFCMLLRKHIGNGLITDVEQMGLERVVRFSVEHRDEMGDLSTKYLYVEIMGKHSNIIFTDSKNRIIDSIKHISFAISSVREVLPGKEYFIPAQEGKINPLSETRADFIASVRQKNDSLKNYILQRYIGFSSITALELTCRASLDMDASTASLSEEDIARLYDEFEKLIKSLEKGEFYPTLVIDKESEKPVEFSAFNLLTYKDKDEQSFESISELLFSYYSKRDIYANMHQRSTDLRKIINNLIARNRKKYDLQMKQYKDTEKKDVFRKRGELIRAYAYNIPAGSKVASVYDYEDEKDIEIPMNPDLDAMKNANDYFEKYQKLKRTEVELKEQLKITEETLNHLLSIQTSLDLCEDEADLNSVRKEMEEAGFVHKSNKKKKRNVKEKPLHYRTKDGFDIYVGKNNFQNDYVTFSIASNDDWWFHAKKMPGSHVIVKTNGAELPDHVFTDCAALAAYYSSGRESDKLEIDYLKKKDLKKPNGSAPGYVIYYTNYSMVIKPGINDLDKIIDA